MISFEISTGELSQLAELYDGFTFGIDPHFPESDEAEKQFMESVAHYYEYETVVQNPAGSLRFEEAADGTVPEFDYSGAEIPASGTLQDDPGKEK